MEMYPALKAKMGTTSYYIVRMQLKEIANKVVISGGVRVNHDLSSELQRKLNEKRAKGEIVNFLKRDDRFFSSIVVAALGGKPEFSAVKIAASESDTAGNIFKAAKIDESFGVLTFDGGEKYYALDGQHRLAAIQDIFKKGKEEEIKGFINDQISVIVITNSDEKKYRRLFSSLNRYAKKTTAETDIIMDEEDTFAILTRRLINEYSFFQGKGEAEIESSRVLMKKPNIKVDSSYFTSLKTLYEIDKILLISDDMKKEKELGKPSNMKQFITSRPSDEVLDNYYNELLEYWNAILHVLPDLKTSPEKMRSDDKNKIDHMFFRPIGQELMAKIVRKLLDDSPKKTKESALSPMEKIDWNLRSYPWRGLVSYEKKGKCVMRSEQRTQAMKLAEDFAHHMLRLEGCAYSPEMHKTWKSLYVPAKEGENIGSIWEKEIKTKLNLK